MKKRESEWDPLCAALSLNKNLKSIRIESRYFPNDAKDTKGDENRNCFNIMK